jgi:hypothetical protein
MTEPPRFELSAATGSAVASGCCNLARPPKESLHEPTPES